MVARLAKLVEKIRLIKSPSSSEKTNWPKNVVYAPISSICLFLSRLLSTGDVANSRQEFAPISLSFILQLSLICPRAFYSARQARSFPVWIPTKNLPKNEKNNKEKKKLIVIFCWCGRLPLCFVAVCVKSLFNDDDSINTNRERPERKRKEKNDFLIGILHGSNMVIIIIDTVGVGWCQREYSRSSMKNPHIHTQ